MKKEVKAFSFTEGTNKKDIRKDIENNPTKFLAEKLSSRFNFGEDNIMSYGYYKEMGFVYYLQAYLKHFVFKQYGSWSEKYALNKTNLRTLIGGKIDKIVEIA